MRAHQATALSIILAATALTRAAASADSWRVDRHDPARTGAASGPVPLASPNVAWRAYAGGYPADSNVHFGVGAPAKLVSSSGGRFVAKDSVSQALLWKSPILGPGWVVSSADLDGDDKPEVIVQTASQAHVLDGGTGALRWSSPPDDIQIMGAVHVTDLDGDHLPDVYLDNGIGAKYGTTLAEAFSFSGGAAHKLWSLPLTISPLSVNAGEDALVDLDGDGIPEVVLASFKSALVVRGSDGATLGTLAPPTAPADNPYFEATALSGELDGQPGKEVLLFQDYPLVSESSMAGIAAYKFDVTSGQQQLLWSANVGNYDGEQATLADMISDLDGDGIDEVIFSFRNGPQWTTQVLAGQSGQLLASALDSRFEGAADLDGQPGKELLLSTSTGLSAYKLDGGALVRLGAPIAGLRTLSMDDPDVHAAGYLSRRLAIVHGPGDRPMVLAGAPVGNPGPFARVNSFSSLTGLELVGGSFQSVASYTPLVGAITGTMRADFATRPYAQVAVGSSAGSVSVLNQNLAPTNGVVWLNGDALGTFVGGYANAAPVLAAADGVGPFVYFPSTFLGAVAADARLASWIIPPIPRWSAANLSAASIIDVGGSPHVVGLEDQSLVALRSDTGAATGTIAMPNGSIRGAPLPLQVSGQPLSVGVDWLIGGGQVSQTKLDFGSQTISWSAPTLNWAGYFGSSVADLDNDGTDEWYTLVFGTLYKRDTSTGSLSTIANYPNMGYALPILAPFKTAAPEILLQGGWEGPRLVAASDGTNLWPDPTSTEPANTVAGARASCSGSPRFVYPALESAHLRTFDSQSGSLAAEKVFAGGHAYDSDQAAIAAGDQPGTLSDVTAIDDLAGSPAALAGSSDGYLYAVDPCTLQLRWAANIGVSLGEPIVADVDGDGDDEIVVSGADGFYYGLDTTRFPSPFLTLTGDSGSDTVELKVGDSVTVSWQSVSNAQGYEFGLVGPDEKAIATPAYQQTSGTTATLSLDGALAGRPYRVSVRATGPAGAGAEALSKAVIVKDIAAPTAKVTTMDGPTLAVSFEAADDLALDHFELSVKHGNGPSSLIDDGMLKGKQQTANASFTPDKSLWGTDVSLEAKVFDSAGLVNATTIAAHVGVDGMVTTGPGTPVSGPQTDPSGPSGTPPGSKAGGESPSGGCTVGAGEGGDASIAIGALIGALSTLRRRRNHA